MNKGGSQKELKFDLLSADVVRLFAEAEGYDSNSVEPRAFHVLASDVNYRLRELVNMSVKLMKHGRKRILTPDHINEAAKELRIQALLGHSTSEAPKLYYLKELRVYARNEGIVKLIPLSLSDFPSTSQIYNDEDILGVKHRLEGCRLNHSSSSSKETGDCSLEQRQKLLENSFAGMVKRAQNPRLRKEILESFANLNSSFKPASVAAILSKLLSLFEPESKIPLSFLSRLVTILIEHLTPVCAREVEGIVGGFGLALCDALIQGYSDEDWDEKTPRYVGLALNAISKKFPHVAVCFPEVYIDKFVRILRNPKESPLSYSTGLIVLQSFGFTSLAQLEVDVFAILKEHYEWNRPVFDSTNPFETMAGPSFARITYVGYWRLFMEWYLHRCVQGYLFCCPSAKVIPPHHFPWQLMELSEELVGPLRLALPECLRVEVQRRPTGNGQFLSSVGGMTLNSLKTGCDLLSKIQTETPLLDQSTKSLPDDDSMDQQQNSVAPPTPTVASRDPTPTPEKTPTSRGQKRPGVGGSGGPGKRRRRGLVKDFFETPKKKRADEGFLFVFTLTDAKVLKDRQVKDNLRQPLKLEDESEKGPRMSWASWLQERDFRFSIHRKKAGRRRRRMAWEGCWDYASVAV